ncbi:MAG TPA: carboxypeptidase-like regulatory domain-containing protein, partial [Prolixibacteraceae bacterium]|nr:carboxypeptidase-like regulatory domain-containing protein [Prolixibacteraceae bacterium]
MRLTLFLLVLNILNAYSASYAQKAKLNLNVQNGQVKDVLAEIETQSEFFFMYDNNQVDVERKVNLEAKAENIDLVLERLFNGTDVNFRVVNRQIVLFPETGGSTGSAQQGAKVKGKVVDASSAPLPGVTVVVKGTTLGVITDLDGNYSLNNVPQNATLQFKFVGMTTKEVVVGTNTTINITLEEETIGIEEVVAIGYGTAKKRDVTGAVGSVKAEAIVRSNPVQPAQALQGQLAGVNVNKVNSRPGSDYTIDIRGVHSISFSSEPLVVIDGVMGGKLNTLNPSDIETMDVLKDAS